MTIALVTGGRVFEDRPTIYDRLDYFHARLGFTLLIHGGAKGADTLAGDWAAARGVPTEVYVPNWNKFGKGAGPMRNRQMLDRVALASQGDGRAVVIWFPGGAGTADCRREAVRRELRVLAYSAEIPG